MKVHLLYRDRDFDFSAKTPPVVADLVQDLELQRVFAAMALGDQYLLEVSSQVVLAGLEDPCEIRYRQSVLSDFIAHPGLLTELYHAAIQAIEERRKAWGIWGRSSRSPTSILSGSVRELEIFDATLKRLRRIADDNKGVVTSEGLTTLFDSLHFNIRDEYFATIEAHLKLLRFREGVLISAELGDDNSGINFVLRRPDGVKRGWKERLGIGARTTYSFTIAPRDDAGAQALEDLRSRGINLVANAVAQSSDHIESYLSALRAELGFYAGCINLRAALEAKRSPICFPEPTPWEPFRLRARGLRDASLALRTDSGVVGNDVDADDRSLIVVTGANSGGKSTFLRSVGLAQVMMQCGLFVNAEMYRASTCEGLFTHFIREEDRSMKSGRLDDELSRMSELADLIGGRSMMLFNESFSTTNEREGSEIARQIVRALLESGVRICFVTHQFDLAEGFMDDQFSGSVLFLRAERERNGVRSFKLVEGEPRATSYGADLYEKIFAASVPRSGRVQPDSAPPTVC